MYQIDNQSRQAVYEQIIEQVEKYILKGVIRAEGQMPSVRAMSMELHLNPNTVQRAYTELDRKGIIYTVLGKGSFVSEKAQEILRTEKRQNLSVLTDQLKEMALAGIPEHEMLELVEQIYQQIKEEKP